ncbi:MAG: hypothetical protein ACLSX5_02955 [Lachnospiraceae bacterium]
MNEHAELLNFIYQNSQMGTETMEQLSKMTKDEEFRAFLEKQQEGYQEFHKRAKHMLCESGFDEKGLGAFEKLRTYLMINVQTMTDKSVSHMAEMLIQGSTMGINDAIKKINAYQGEDSRIVKLMEELQKFEEKSLEKLKGFL